MEYNNFWTAFLTYKKHYFLIFIRPLKCEAQTYRDSVIETL